MEEGSVEWLLHNVEWYDAGEYNVSRSDRRASSLAVPIEEPGDYRVCFNLVDAYGHDSYQTTYFDKDEPETFNSLHHIADITTKDNLHTAALVVLMKVYNWPQEP